MTRKQMISKLSILLLSGAAVGLTGCGQGFSAASSGSVLGASSSTGASTPAADAAFKALDVNGTIAGGSDTTTQVIEIDKINKMVIARLPVPLGTLGGSALAGIAIPQVPGATIGIEATPSGGSALVVKIPLATYLKGVDLLPTAGLPNGDPLPAVPDGEMPSVALQLNGVISTPITLYLAKTVIGIYVQSPVNPYIGLTLPIRNKAKTVTWGYFSSIPAKGTSSGGFFMSLKLPNEVAIVIDDVI